MPADVAEQSRVLDPKIFHLAVEACPCGMIVVGGDGAIALINGEIERLFGYRRSELHGQAIEVLLSEILPTGEVPSSLDYTAHPRLHRLGTPGDFTGRRKDGSEFPVEIGFNRIYIDGETMVVAAIVDIGEHKRRERIQDELVATVSHELRTPLTSIAASLALLRAGASARLSRPAVHLLDIAHANCQRLVRMVNDILDIKKLVAGEMTFHFQRCKARALLANAIEANKGFAASCAVGIRLEASAAIEIQVDPDRFIQVITNLLSNAVKFTIPGQEVAVKLERCGTDIRIAVRDHGPGIPAEFRPRVFESFAQADSPDVRRKGGSGLGLSIVRELVTRMRGRVGFADAPGGGTVFYIDLPDADTAASGRDALAATPERAGGAAAGAV